MDEDHLHRETKVLPVKEHATMLTKQFYSAFYSSDHPGNKYINHPKQPRDKKKTLLIHKNEIENIRQGGLMVKDVMAKIHTNSVKDAIEGYNDSKVLNRPPPEIDKEEQSLPRKVRVELARLRSGYSRRLNSYNNRIDDLISDQCPKCTVSPHNVAHLFECAENETSLVLTDLWQKPREIADFLRLEEDDS